jgi:hypothetical protein
MSRHVFALTGALVAAAIGPPAARAWNETGHKAVALIACFELEPGQKMAMAELLKNHPHTKIQTEQGLAVARKQFTGDNFFTAGLPDGVSEADWVIVRAATWPDFVRPPKFSPLSPVEIAAHEIFKYHRGPHHFDNKAFVLEGFKGATPANEGKIFEALDKAGSDLRDSSVSKADKAIALCWLLHLIGDLHQPLHCTMLVSNQFPNGDQGGNKMLIGSTNLHSFWDELLGRAGIPFAHLNDLAVTIHRAPQWQRGALNELRSTTYQAWAAESVDLAKAVAYDNGKLKVATSDHQHDDGAQDIQPFPADYRKEALPIVQRRVALAGLRLKDKLSEFFPVSK